MRFIFVTGVIALLLTSCSANEKEDTANSNIYPNVNAIAIKKDSISIPVYSVGTLSSKTQSNLSFITGGIISRFYISEGDIVSKNDLLVKLDMTETESRLKQASLAYDKAKRDFRRAENLYRDTVITLEQYENANTALEMAQSNFRIAEFHRENSEIRAPTAGKILKKLKESNEIVGSGHPVIIFASTEADWILKVNLADKDIVRISKGDSASISFDAYPGKTYSALVYEIATVASLMSGTYEVELKLSDLPDRLVTGLIGQAKIYPARKQLLFLPLGGLVEAAGNEGVVFVLKNGKAVRTEILVGEITEKGIVISSGLEEGDKVITNGNAWLRDGQKVEVVK